jgi:hypothetical protein
MVRDGTRIDEKVAKSIRKDMDAFKVDPRDASTYLGQPSFDLNGSGTHFYILPADEIIQDDIDDRDESTKATRFEKKSDWFHKYYDAGFPEAEDHNPI